jgi:hypothetical protein
MKSSYISVFILSCAAICSTAFAVDGYLWNCDEFPELASNASWFNSGGSGSRHIVDTLGQYGETPNPLFDQDGNHYYFVNADHPSDTGGYGYYFDAKSSVWTNQDSTIEIRLNIEAYLDNKTDVLGVLVMGANKTYGFRWGRASTTNNTPQIRKVESSAGPVNFDHFQHFVTYRILYYATAGYAELYYYDAGEMKFLLRSDGFAFTSADMLRVGDYTSQMAGRWTIDYVYWTNSGIYKTDALFCGSAAYTYLKGDINKDCAINLKDIAVIGNDWLGCTNPENTTCDAWWQSLTL